MTEVEWLDIFRDNLEDLLQEYGYSQKDLAEEAGLSTSTISRCLAKDVNKRKMPSIRTVVNIAYALECDIEDIIYFDDMIE